MSTHPTHKAPPPDIRSKYSSFLPPILLGVGAVLAGLSAFLPFLNFHLDSATATWTAASGSKAGVWGLWGAAALCLASMVMSLRGRLLTYLPGLTAILYALTGLQVLLSGLSRVPRSGGQRILITENSRQWSSLGHATHLTIEPGSALFVAAAAILCMAAATWCAVRTRRLTPASQYVERER